MKKENRKQFEKNKGEGGCILLSMACFIIAMRFDNYY